MITLRDNVLSNISLDASLQAKKTKPKINIWDFHQIKKVLYKEYHQQNEKTTN